MVVTYSPKEWKAGRKPWNVPVGVFMALVLVVPCL
jgi:hypothetical protein